MMKSDRQTAGLASSFPDDQPQIAAEETGPTVGTPFLVKQNEGTASITIASATHGPALGGTFDIPAKNGGFLILDVLRETKESHRPTSCTSA